MLTGPQYNDACPQLIWPKRYGWLNRKHRIGVPHLESTLSIFGCDIYRSYFGSHHLGEDLELWVIWYAESMTTESLPGPSEYISMATSSLLLVWNWQCYNAIGARYVCVPRNLEQRPSQAHYPIVTWFSTAKRNWDSNNENSMFSTDGEQTQRQQPNPACTIAGCLFTGRMGEIVNGVGSIAHGRCRRSVSREISLSEGTEIL